MNLFDGINENDKDAMLKCLDMQRILTVCSSACEFHTRLIHNLLTILAEKNLMLTHKIEHMAQKNTRDKLLSYLSVDRSAMSRELSHMKEEGILEYQRNRFRLISPRISS